MMHMLPQAKKAQQEICNFILSRGATLEDPNCPTVLAKGF
jgi:hypothetical protein